MPAAGLIVGGITSVVAASKSAKASKRAAATAKEGTDKAIAAQERQYAQTRADLAPWREAGGRALGMLEQNLFGTPFGGFGKKPAPGPTTPVLPPPPTTGYPGSPGFVIPPGYKGLVGPFVTSPTPTPETTPPGYSGGYETTEPGYKGLIDVAKLRGAYA